jgi:murein DD-endopeptidase MepM/ murein hydrolase activator NlpD
MRSVCLPVALVVAASFGGAGADNNDPGVPPTDPSADVRARRDHRDIVYTAGTWLGTASADLTVLTTSPVKDVESSGYGWRDHPTLNRRKFHHGTDFSADRWTPVLAAGDGVVAWTGRNEGYGKSIEIDHGGGVLTRYAHLHRIEVKAGDVVMAGSQIGRVGSTGRTTGAHLHFEVRLDGRSVDPKVAMKVGDLQRTSPDLAATAARELDPEIQNKALDAHDPTNRKRARRHRRPQVLW